MINYIVNYIYYIIDYNRKNPPPKIYYNHLQYHNDLKKWNNYFYLKN